jgi:hypothetical protein
VWGLDPSLGKDKFIFHKSKKIFLENFKNIVLKA